MRKDTPEAILLQAQELIERVQRDLADGDAFFRASGLDRQEFHDYLQHQLTPHEKEQARKALRQQMADIEQELREEATRRSFAEAPLRGVRRPRLMV
ncbi:hypothetical protein [Comamonas endophytica]|uniref:Uncharacterized protein n=1 Tax=Comamonas endophytica TaxID=2949090 RepID=A0ABY6GEA0_9BURK|nr:MULTISPECIES: hypothetical protein [unclassified Acidovorax]MCD2512848.1 hypothetical protein [Acidovorax sp. D4N7]UYG52804.1 hypothetical protein M9799_06070 [Acidovorax sp. 5MLIR]